MEERGPLVIYPCLGRGHPGKAALPCCDNAMKGCCVAKFTVLFSEFLQSNKRNKGVRKKNCSGGYNEKERPQLMLSI